MLDEALAERRAACFLGVCSGSSMPDNNGNLLKQQIYIPGHQMRWQQYDYDSLNRLKWAREVLDGGAEQWKQKFLYDRWGNRTIDTAVTHGTGINNKAFTVNTVNNRLGVPGDQSGVMTYDAAGNLRNDTYTGAGNRTYDAENKITSAWGGNNQAQLYTYDASGQRIKRKVDNVETWQVYGFGGELLAEYAASGGGARLQKEYGYRNGQLLITADGRTNVALAANGAAASASSAHTCCGFSVGGAINGNVRGPWGNGEGWNDATENVLPDWFQVDFSGSKTIDEIDVFSLHDNYTEPNTPTETQTLSLYGLVNFQVQYWNGSAWTTIPGGNVSGNNKVWRKFVFAPITTSKIRLWITSVPDAWSRLVELQAWEAGSAAPVRWLVTDHLGTPRMVLDQTGSLANMKRHDYLPFGEELVPPTGGRSAAQGYGGGDGVRQQFTLQERDVETGLDYFGARYYSSIQGRFSSADLPLIDQHQSSPQTWNLYTYGSNNSLRFVDADGFARWDKNGNFVGDYNGEYNADLEAVWVAKGRYWDFEQGRQLARDIEEITRKLFNDAFERYVEQQIQLAKIRAYLQRKYGPCTRCLGGTLIVFGPITNMSRLLPPAAEVLQLGTARMNLLNAVQNPTLRRIIEYAYRPNAKIGNGSTADVIRFERETGILMSKTGHTQKGNEVLQSLEALVRSNKLNPKDTEIAQQLIADITNALK